MWTSSDKIDQLEYALRIGKELADYFEVEFDMEYHLPKLGKCIENCKIYKPIKYKSLKNDRKKIQCWIVGCFSVWMEMNV